ncbi:hypothetical protein P3T24_005972 [Paraburkholderia sp. GAS33]|jgi:hypothetical protein|uniref:Uncharacterized protein n=1 Tax=Paraburkholderia phenazinium TaxID=60549 RepID=A0A1N6I4T9_9BURK|nr:hypothetical protein SAMN05444168_3972 [Paraburkholderia phenazinium]
MTARDKARLGHGRLGFDTELREARVAGPAIALRCTSQHAVRSANAPGSTLSRRVALRKR